MNPLTDFLAKKKQNNKVADAPALTQTQLRLRHAARLQRTQGATNSVIQICGAAGFLALFWYSGWGGITWYTPPILLLMALGLTVLGALAGFLFGIPRSSAAPLVGQAATGPNRSPLQINTNLETISDWLTKGITLLALTQYKVLPRYLYQYAEILSKHLTPRPNVDFALGILLFFPAYGFLTGYLWTRLYISALFQHADDDMNDPLPDALLRLALYPSQVAGGAPVVCALALDGPALADTPVALTSSDPSATLPASVVIPRGSVSASFPIATTAPAAAVTATITASIATLTADAPLTITPP